ncbi:Malolactic regulator [Lactococcus cremoris]|nr:Malolactic regulator [Lactococcus cremoris]
MTPEGDLLAMRTNEILSELNHTKKAIHRSSMKDFKVGFPPIISSYLLSKMILSIIMCKHSSRVEEY